MLFINIIRTFLGREYYIQGLISSQKLIDKQDTLLFKKCPTKTLLIHTDHNIQQDDTIVTYNDKILSLQNIINNIKKERNILKENIATIIENSKKQVQDKLHEKNTLFQDTEKILEETTGKLQQLQLDLNNKTQSQPIKKKHISLSPEKSSNNDFITHCNKIIQNNFNNIEGLVNKCCKKISTTTQFEQNNSSFTEQYVFYDSEKNDQYNKDMITFFQDLLSTEELENSIISRFKKFLYYISQEDHSSINSTYLNLENKIGKNNSVFKSLYINHGNTHRTKTTTQKRVRKSPNTRASRSISKSSMNVIEKLLNSSTANKILYNSVYVLNNTQAKQDDIIVALLYTFFYYHNYKNCFNAVMAKYNNKSLTNQKSTSPKNDKYNFWSCCNKGNTIEQNVKLYLLNYHNNKGDNNQLQSFNITNEKYKHILPHAKSIKHHSNLLQNSSMETDLQTSIEELTQKKSKIKQECNDLEKEIDNVSNSEPIQKIRHEIHTIDSNINKYSNDIGEYEKKIQKENQEKENAQNQHKQKEQDLKQKQKLYLHNIYNEEYKFFTSRLVVSTIVAFMCSDLDQTRHQYKKTLCEYVQRVITNNINYEYCYTKSHSLVDVITIFNYLLNQSDSIELLQTIEDNSFDIFAPEENYYNQINTTSKCQEKIEYFFLIKSLMLLVYKEDDQNMQDHFRSLECGNINYSTICQYLQLSCTNNSVSHKELVIKFIIDKTLALLKQDHVSSDHDFKNTKILETNTSLTHIQNEESFFKSNILDNDDCINDISFRPILLLSNEVSHNNNQQEKINIYNKLHDAIYIKHYLDSYEHESYSDKIHHISNLNTYLDIDDFITQDENDNEINDYESTLEQHIQENIDLLQEKQPYNLGTNLFIITCGATSTYMACSVILPNNKQNSLENKEKNDSIQDLK